jgi:hypothetical protein
VSLQFGSNELIKKMLFKLYDEFLIDDDNDTETLPISLVLASGLLTGIPSSIAVVFFLSNNQDTSRSHKNSYASSKRK